ncbi:MAG: aminotransferase class V-fold PLP-dependent enzyme [Lachnospiraceae bacterium]|nr:aminotransferase class V-fold PLP-dependent enzyme [Lachnospiraceae bacterium]
MSELLEKLKNYADSDHLPMHMPGHKRRMGDLGNPFFIDITEIEGFDDLHHAEGILRDAQQRAARLYGSEETHYLVNGSTAGILAAVSGCVSAGGTILVARNCHQSVIHAALLRELDTMYIYPQPTVEMWINGQILAADVDKALREKPDIQAVLLTSPTYDGVVSDVESIAEIAHAHGIPLIVDEAHGAHFPFSDYFPRDAVSCSADVVVTSLHKTLPSLTQTALIHLNGGLIDREKIRFFLRVYQTSSPSYVLMAGIDQCIDWIGRNRAEFDRFGERLTRLRVDLGKMQYLRLLEFPDMDRSRILVSGARAGISGKELAARLRKDYRIEPEMAGISYVCMLTSVADQEEELRRLGDAFLRMDAGIEKGEAVGVEQEVAALPKLKRVCSMQAAFDADAEWIPLKEAGGRISAGFVVPYPPGIALLTPGEEIDEAVLQSLACLPRAGCEMRGIRNGRLRVIKRGCIWEKFSV